VAQSPQLYWPFFGTTESRALTLLAFEMRSAKGKVAAGKNMRQGLKPGPSFCCIYGIAEAMP
jgi:hypothetical protein